MDAGPRAFVSRTFAPFEEAAHGRRESGAVVRVARSLHHLGLRRIGVDGRGDLPEAESAHHSERKLGDHLPRMGGDQRGAEGAVAPAPKVEVFLPVAEWETVPAIVEVGCLEEELRREDNAAVPQAVAEPEIHVAKAESLDLIPALGPVRQALGRERAEEGETVPDAVLQVVREVRVGELLESLAAIAARAERRVVAEEVEGQPLIRGAGVRRPHTRAGARGGDPHTK